jgi:hypothetical protein
MKVITEGHKYCLANFEGTGCQPIQFIEKVLDRSDLEENLVTVNDGTTNEEVLAMLIDRMEHLQSKFPCKENAIVITNLQESLLWLESRTRKRKQRGVEGKHMK